MQIPWFRGRSLDLSRKVLAALVVVAVLGISAVAGRRASSLPLRLIGGGVVGLIFSLIALRNMRMALTLLIATSATVGITISTGTQTPLPLGLPIVALLAVLWLGRMVVEEHRIRLTPSRLNLPFFGFVVAAGISWLAGYVIWDWRIPPMKSNMFFVQAGQVAIFALSVAAFLLTANHPLRKTDLKRWTVVIIGVGVAVPLFWVVRRSRPPLPGVTGSMLTWPFVLLWAQLLFNPNLKPWMRWGGWLSLPVWAYWAYTYASYWKGGWVPALVGLFLLLWFKSRRVFLIVVVLAALLVVTNWEQLEYRLYSVEFDSGSAVKPLMWYDVIRMTASRSILLGLGPANYYYYWADPTFIPLSRLAAGWDLWNAWGYAPPSHNMFVDIFAQTGLIGLGFFIWAIVAALRLGFRLRARFRPGFHQAHVYGVLCGFVALLLSSFYFADWLIPFVYNITITGFQHSVYSWLLLGTLVALDDFSKGAEDG